jgi:hypothetical protein
MLRCVQVVPDQSHDHDAVLSHAQVLAAALERHAPLECSLLGADTLRDRSSGSLLAALEERGACAVLVHYVNYAYQPRGCPRWLVDGLARWRSSVGARLVTLFHEVHASGPPWTSAFWLRVLQRSLARRLLHASDAAVTSLPWYREQLRALGGDAQVLALFSACGEPEEITDIRDRPPALLVFGGLGARRRIYGPLRGALERAVRCLRATRVHDVGVPVEVPATIGEARLEQLGPLPAAELSRWLLSVRGGVCAHAPAFLGKSSVYAAFAAHGAAPVVLGRGGLAGEPSLEPHWSPWTEPVPNLEALAGVARAANRAYREHDLATHVRLFGRLLRGGPSGST